MGDAERVVGQRCGGRQRGAVAGVVEVELAPPTEPAQHAGDQDHGHAAAAPGELLLEPAADDHASIDRVERYEPAARAGVPVVVVDRRVPVTSGRPEEHAVPVQDRRLEVDARVPPWRGGAVAAGGHHAHVLLAADGEGLGEAAQRREGRDHAPGVQLARHVQLDARRARRQRLGDEESRRLLLSRLGTNESAADHDGPLHVGGERACPRGRHAAQWSGCTDIGSQEGAHHAVVVQRDDNAGAGHVEDGVDVEVVLRRLVLREDRLVEDGAWLQVGPDEHHVASEVAPRTEAVERRHPPDAVGLRVVHAALGVRVDLHAPHIVHSTSSSARMTSCGCTTSRQRPSAGHRRGRHSKPRRSTRSL